MPAKGFMDRIMIVAIAALGVWYFTPKSGTGPVRFLADTVYVQVPDDTMKLGCVLDTAQWVGVNHPQWIVYQRNHFPDSVWMNNLYAPIDLLATQALERAWARTNVGAK